MCIKIKVLIVLLILTGIGCKEEPSFKKRNSVNNNDSIQYYYQFSKNKSNNSKIRLTAITKAYQLAEKANNDSLIIKTLTYKSQRHNTSKQYDSALIYSRELLNISKTLKDSTSIDNAYFKLGLYNHKLNISDSAFYYYNRSKKYM